MANDRNIAIRKADKGSCVVVWDPNGEAEAEKLLSDENVYKDINFKDLLLLATKLIKLKISC